MTALNFSADYYGRDSRAPSRADYSAGRQGYNQDYADYYARQGYNYDPYAFQDGYGYDPYNYGYGYQGQGYETANQGKNKFVFICLISKAVKVLKFACLNNMTDIDVSSGRKLLSHA